MSVLSMQRRADTPAAAMSASTSTTGMLSSSARECRMRPPPPPEEEEEEDGLAEGFALGLEGAAGRFFSRAAPASASAAARDRLAPALGSAERARLGFDGEALEAGASSSSSLTRRLPERRR